MTYIEGKWVHTLEDEEFARKLDAIEANMNLDCPDSYQVRGMKEDDEED